MEMWHVSKRQQPDQGAHKYNKTKTSQSHIWVFKTAKKYRTRKRTAGTM